MRFVEPGLLVDGVEEESSVGDEGHEDAEDGAHDDGGLFRVLHVYPNEEEAFYRKKYGSGHGEDRMPVECGG